jgi:hypothetical protein
MEEMRQLISKRSGDMTPRSQFRASKEATSTDNDAIQPGDVLRSIGEAVSEADKSLVRAASSQEALAVDVGLLARDLKEVSLEHRLAISLIKKMLIRCHRKQAFLKRPVWNSRAPNDNVSL